MAGLALHPGWPVPVRGVRQHRRHGAGHLRLRVRFRARRPRRQLEKCTDPRRPGDRVRRRSVPLPAADSDAGIAVEFAGTGVGAVMETALTDLWYGFTVAVEPHNLMYCFLGVLIGNMVGVLPGKGPLATISTLLPRTFGNKPVGAILMLSGIFYGSQYGGAICPILLN